MTGLFGSAILDVAVGMVFVYLLVSLVVSAASELIASMLKWRSKHLWKGINNLLRDAKESLDNKGSGDKKGSTPAVLAAALYDHPLIKSLAQPGKKPSYIPSRTFALVLLDVVKNPTGLIKAELLKLTDGLPAENRRTEVQAKIGTILDSGMPMTELKAELNGLISPLPDGELKSRLLALTNKIPADPSDVKGLIDLFPNEDIKKTLRVLWEESGHNLEKLKEGIEVWFNNAMDRVSGWYKRKSQLVNFIVAIVIAIWVNIDSEVIAKRLSTDSTLRTALAAQAEEYAKLPSNRPTTPSTAGAGQQATGAQPQATDAGAGAAPASAQDLKDEFAERKKAVDESLKEIGKLGLPIGYRREGSDTDPIDLDRPSWPGSIFRFGWPVFDWEATKRWGSLFPEHGFGWLFTAVAASLGAPFWFDILNKIITIRSAGKAPEEKPKAPKEEPKPLGPGETPEERRASEQATTALLAGVGALTNWAAKQEDKSPPAEVPPK